MMKSSHVKEILIPKRSLLVDLKFMDREPVRAFHNNVYLVYLQVCSLRLSHTGRPGERGDREDL